MTELPVEYIPMSRQNLFKGMECKVDFVINPHSHEKCIGLAKDSDINNQTKIETPYLFPSEMWGFARAFSSHFGRLNEAAVSKAIWDIYGTAFPQEQLKVKSKINCVGSRKGLTFATAETTTENEKGRVLLHSIDKILLLHDAPKLFYREQEKEAIHPTNTVYEKTRRVYFRHDWDNGKWLNNVHTDEYARQFGYQKGLPEFIMYMDWIFLSQLERFREKAYKKTTIDLRKILPIYKDELIKITSEKEGNNELVRFFRRNQERVRAIVK